MQKILKRHSDVLKIGSHLLPFNQSWVALQGQFVAVSLLVVQEEITPHIFRELRALQLLKKCGVADLNQAL